MKFRLSKFHLLGFVSMTTSHSLQVLSGEINMDRKIEKTSTKSCLFKLSGSYVHCKRTISRDETWRGGGGGGGGVVIDTKHNERNFDRLNFIEFSSQTKSSCSEKLL